MSNTSLEQQFRPLEDHELESVSGGNYTTPGPGNPPVGERSRSWHDPAAVYVTYGYVNAVGQDGRIGINSAITNVHHI